MDFGVLFVDNRQMKPIISVQDQLVDQIRRYLLSGHYAAGQRLREEDFARQFGVSRGPIRDVFLRLTREGLLEARPNAGVSVAAEPSPFKRRSLLSLRRKLEVDCLRKASKENAGDLLNKLQSNLKLYQPACQSEDLEEVVRLDMDFHRIIVSTADAGSMVRVWEPIISQFFLRYSRHHSLMESYREHERIVKGIEADDAIKAVRALREHIV